MPLLRVSKKWVSFRASAHTGVGIPLIDVKTVEKLPKKLGDCHTSLRAGSQ